MTSPIYSPGEYGVGVGASQGYSLPGVGPVPYQEGKTSHQMVEEYKKWLGVIETIMKQSSFTADDVKKIQEAVDALASLAKNGDTSHQPPAYMSPKMLECLDPILGLLATAGIVPNGGTSVNTSEAISGLKVLQAYEKSVEQKTVTFASLLADASFAVAGADKSLQDMLYYDIFGTANAAFNEELAILEEALNVSKDVGKLLAELQEFRNKHIHAPSDVPEWQKDPKNPTAPVIDDLTTEDLMELARLAKDLEKQINSLKAPPPNGQGIPDEEGTLTHSLQLVLNDIGWALDAANSVAYLDEAGKTNPDGTFPPETEAARKKAWEDSGLPLPVKEVTVADPWNDPYWIDKIMRAWAGEFWGSPDDEPDLNNWPKTEAERKEAWDVMVQVVGWQDKTTYTTPVTVTDPWNYPEYMSKVDLDKIKTQKFDKMLTTGTKDKAHAWLLDGQDTMGSTSGKNQGRIDTAITYNSNFNSDQNQELKAIQADFDQIAKLLNEMLQDLHKQLHTIAQGIRGG